MTWRVARSLLTLIAEINAAAPGRDKTSDGTIGDAAHAARDSDHNPWVIDPDGIGVVRAADITNDLPDVDCDDLAFRLAELLGVHPALGSGAYVIWDRRICSTDRLAEGWRLYTGSNPHNKHLHLSVGTAGYDSTAPFGVMGEDDMPFTEEQLRTMMREEATKAARAVLDEDMNINEPKGDPRFRGMTVRALLKKLATATGVVPRA